LLAHAWVRGCGKPGVEVVEDRFDGWPQLVGDLILALARLFLTGLAANAVTLQGRAAAQGEPGVMSGQVSG
jgi:hypothetical protein